MDAQVEDVASALQPPNAADAPLGIDLCVIVHAAARKHNLNTIEKCLDGTFSASRQNVDRIQPRYRDVEVPSAVAMRNMARILVKELAVEVRAYGNAAKREREK